MKIPFGLTFSGLLLSGKERERAKINYEKIGIDKDLSLLELDYNSDELKNLYEYKIKRLNILKQYDKVNEYEYNIQLNEIMNENDKLKKELNELDIQRKFHKITDIEYYKQYNDLKGKPWVAIRSSYDEENNPDNLEVEIVYNKTFISQMKSKGLPGDTDEEIAEQWLKLFMIANLDEDDISSLIDENVNSYETKQIVSATKIDNQRKIMG